MKEKAIITFILTLLIIIPQAASQKVSSTLNHQLQENPSESVRVIVYTKDTPTKSSVRSSGAKAHRVYSHTPGYAATLTPKQIENLIKDPNINSLHIDARRRILTPEGGRAGVRLQTSVGSVGARLAHQENITGKNITVAVIDTGIDYTHPDLGGCFGAGCRVVAGYDFVNNDGNPMDDHGHGTHVAGTIGANGTLIGVAPDALFQALKVCGTSGYCWDSDIIAAIDWAITNNADVISMSLGEIIHPNDGVGSLTEACETAVENGIVVAVAAGNNGAGASTIEHPGSVQAVITVGSISDQGTTRTSDDGVSSFSSRGPSAFGRLDPDLMAPGSNIYSTVPDGVYRIMSGTSMATPHVSGAAALLLEAEPFLTPLEVRAALMHATENFSGRVFHWGSGGLNVSRAIRTDLFAVLPGGDRFEGEVIAGETGFFTVTFSNTGNTSTNLSFTVGEFKDVKNSKTMSPSVIEHPVLATIPANGSVIVRFNVSVPSNASAGTYGGIISAESSSGDRLRLPAVLNVPLMLGYTTSGLVNIPGDGWGDRIYFPVKPANTHGLLFNLSWASGDLDLYLYAPNGELVGSVTDSARPKTLRAYNLSYDTYWIMVHATDFSAQQEYNLTLDILSNFTVDPPLWVGQYGGNNTPLTFTITNDNESKDNMALRAVSIESGQTIKVNQSREIPKRTLNPLKDPENYTYSELSCNTTLLEKDLNLSIANMTHFDGNISWSTYHDLDLYLVYWSDDGDGLVEAGELHDTDYYSMDKNNISGSYHESLEYVDILYYIKEYSDVGLSTCNMENETIFNATINLSVKTYEEKKYERATIDPSVINLSASEQKNITFSLNISGIPRNQQTTLTLLAGEYARVPILFESGNPETPTLKQLDEYTNKTTITLTWTESKSSSPINHYTIYYSVNGIFNDSTSINSTETTKNFTVAEGNASFRVIAADNDGFESPPSNIVFTIVDETPPTTPTLQIGPQDSLNHTPIVNWTKSADTTSGLANYTIEIATDINFTNKILQANTTNTTLQTNLSDGDYYARVKAVDKAGNHGNHSTTQNKEVKTIRLNEVKTGTDSWIELYNTRSHQAELANWLIVTLSGNLSLTENITHRSTHLINLTQANITLNTTDETINLVNNWGQLIDNLTIQNSTENTSTGRNKNGIGEWATYNSSTMTPGGNNYETLTHTLAEGWNIFSLPIIFEW